ncbi:HmuY family protein [Psychroflexus sediminis]|uniref:HmuY protein n=1 Tax=Psychroflexus sediminis TaxID=470826 RepID=A0A1G7UGS6_9FLAO|nr:HmuY family protein [Psychroflexus sediminis]SDG46548.1 HmuY protein [Psychroflexus sediminis]
MNTLKLTPFILMSLCMLSCSDDDDVMALAEVESTTIENLHAPQEGGRGEPISGSFTKFDFETGQITDSDTEWDIAFRGTTIAVNGGTVTGTIDEPLRTSDAGITLVSATFEDITEIPADTSFDQDSHEGFAVPAGSGNGWYNYDFTTNILNPIPGKILLVETTDGKYAKFEILSYYKDAPSDIDPFQDESRYYTFRYAYNPNEGQVTFN